MRFKTLLIQLFVALSMIGIVSAGFLSTTVIRNPSGWEDNGSVLRQLTDNPVNISGNVSIGGGFSEGGIDLTTLGDISLAGDILIQGDILTITDQEINGSFLPTQDAVFSLGSALLRWNNIFFGGTLTGPLFTGNNSQWSKIGTNVFLTTLTDKVGIGTATPDRALSMADDAFIGFGAGSGGRPDFQIGYPSAVNVLSIRAGFGADTDDIVVDTSGRLGIGTTNPIQLLHIDSTVAPVIQLSRTDSTISINNGMGSLIFGGTGGGVIKTAAGILAKADGTWGSSDQPIRLEIVTTPDGSSIEKVRMVIGSNGNIGIGIDTTPDALLDVQGTFHADSTATFNNNVGIRTPSPIFTLDVNGTINTSLLLANNIGIGVTSPAAAFEIVSRTQPQLRIRNRASDTTSFDIFVGTNDAAFNVLNPATGSGMNWQIQSDTKMVLADSGNLGIGKGGGDIKPSERLVVLGNLSINHSAGTSSTLFVDSTAGRVGIGTTTPTTTLDVQGTLNVSGNASIGNILTVDTTFGNIAFNAATNPQHGVDFGGFTTSKAGGSQTLFNVGGAITTTAGSNQVWKMIFGGGATNTAAAADVYAIAGTFRLAEPNFQLGAGSSVTEGYTLLIDNAPTEATRNYALKIGGGLSRFDGQIQAALGGENAPSYSFISGTSADINTGMFSPTADSLALSAGAVEFLTLSEGTNDILIINNDGDDIDFRIEASGVTDAFFVQGSSGNVGIGDTSPTAKLEVRSGNIRMSDPDVAHGMTARLPTDVFFQFSEATTNAGGILMRTISEGDKSAWKIEGFIGNSAPTEPAILFTSGKSDGGTGTANTGDTEIHSQWRKFDGTKLITILGGGNVGIGTTTPSQKLEVVGYINVTGTATSNSTFNGDVEILGTLYGGSPVKIAGVNISNNIFSLKEDRNQSSRFTLQNLNNGSNASAVIEAINDMGASLFFGIGSSNFMLGDVGSPNITALISRSPGDMIFANSFKEAFIWYNNPQDDGDLNNLVEVMRLTEIGNLQVENDMLIEGKLDIGKPGAGGGLDIGEGGSYTMNHTGTVIVQAFTYDASAASGSRFTEFTDLDASNTMLADPGDRLYIGSDELFWATRFEIATAMGDQHIQMRYYDGLNLSNMTHMAILKDSAVTEGEKIWNQTAEKEYTIWDHAIQDDWTRADNIDDLIPDGDGNKFWIIYEVPPAGISNAPVFTEIKVRGTDIDYVTGLSFQVLWGNARLGIHERISLAVVRSPAGTSTIDLDIDSAHKQTVFNFNGAGDELSFLWVLPECIDTSSKIEVKLDASADAADTFDLTLTASRLKNNTVIGSGVSPGFQESTPITFPAANTFLVEQPLTAEGISIENMSSSDVISFELERTDASNAMYPFSLTIHYLKWCAGNLATLED